MANPKALSWVGATSYVDGTPFGQADLAGYEVEVNALDAFSIPVAWNVENIYSFPVIDLPNLKQGSNVVRMRTAATNGQVSDWTGPVTFQFVSTPEAPTNVVVS
jgi:hypothetical protein